MDQFIALGGGRVGGFGGHMVFRENGRTISLRQQSIKVGLQKTDYQLTANEDDIIKILQTFMGGIS